MPATEYVILEREDDGRWARLSGTTEAHGADEAVRKYVGGGAGVYVAVPARSWQPFEVSTTNVPRTIVKPVEA